MKHDLKRAADSVLSGLTTTPEMQKNLIRTAMASQPQKRIKENTVQNRVKLKLNLSLSFGLPHMVVAAIAIILVMMLPAFIEYEKLKATQSEDEGWYIIQGNKGPQSQVAQAEHKQLPGGNYMFDSMEEAFKFAGSFPIPTWIPERYESYQIMLNVMVDGEQELLREFCWIVATPDQKDSVIFNWTFYADIESAMTYVEQNEAGEYVTLSNGQSIYCSSNYQYESAVWIDGATEYFLGGSLTREETIRMAESVKVP